MVRWHALRVLNVFACLRRLVEKHYIAPTLSPGVALMPTAPAAFMINFQPLLLFRYLQVILQKPDTFHHQGNHAYHVTIREEKHK